VDRSTASPCTRSWSSAVIGALDRLEIWSLPAWETYLEQKEEGFAETSEEVIPGLF
jgi:MraZ protein